jgi:DHA3 family macrolide efflux protein-like MFS transporter
MTAESAAPQRPLLRANAGFRNLWCAHLVSVFGDGLYNVALPWYVYLHTRSSIATALTFAVGTLPYLLVGPFAGVFVDRWNRRFTLVAADLLRAATLIAASLVLMRGFNLGAVIAVAFLLPVFSRFFVPAQRATTPALVGLERLVSANALMEGAGNVASIAGPVLSGALIVAIGAVPLLLIDAATFLISAAFLSRIRFPRQEKPAGPRASVLSELAEGVRLAWRVPVLRVLCLQAPFANGFFAAFVVLLPVWIARSAHAGAAAYGALMAAFFAGSFGASLLLARYGSKISRAVLVLAGLFAIGVMIAAFGFSRNALLGGAFLTGVGISAATFNIGVLTLLQLGAPPEQHGRVFALNETCSYSLRPIASLALGALADAWTVNNTIVLMGGAMLGLWVIMLACSRALQPPATFALRSVPALG